MVSRELLKEVIATNIAYILEKVRPVVPRESIAWPHITGKVVVFHGVRRSGKTFLLYEALKGHPEQGLYLDFEDDRLEGFAVADFALLKAAFFDLYPQQAGSELLFLLDEVQKIPGWERFARRAVEREGDRVAVAGSSSAISPSGIHTSLRGRAWSQEVLPFSFREVLLAKGIPVGKEPLFGAKKVPIRVAFREYLSWGGFPEVVMASADEDRRKLLKEYYGAMFFRDLVERYKIKNAPLLERLSETLFSSCSRKVSLSALQRQWKQLFAFSKDLLYRYYAHFLDSTLIHEIRKFAPSVHARNRNPAKVYLVDTGLARRITSADLGHLLENAVFLELKRRGYEMSYFEAEREVDFLARRDAEKTLPVQVTWELTKSNRDREIEGLLEACRALDLREGLILTDDQEEDIDRGGIRISVRGAWRWMLAP
jgi:uncharacterized protein